MTTALAAHSTDDDVITVDSSCCGGLHSSQISIREIVNRGNQQVEMTVPGVRVVMTPAGADKLRLWLDQWIVETTGAW
jgi:hypothetical protein